MKNYFWALLVLFFSKNSYAEQKKPYDVSICAIFNNEAPYLKEWIEYHRLIGVDHFYLYNNDSTDDFQSVLAPYIDKGIVEVKRWPKRAENYLGEQIRAYNDCLKQVKAKTKWLAIIDLDEFILPIQADSLKEFLRQFDQNEEIGAIQINWQMFGTSHIEKLKEDQLTIENFIWKAPEFYDEEPGPNNTRVKSIFKPYAVDSCLIHHVRLKEGFFVWPHNKKNLTSDSQKIDCTEIQINHYWTRDEQYFLDKKIPRRETWTKKDQDFLIEKKNKMNYEKDLKIFKYVTTLRKKMGLEP